MEKSTAKKGKISAVIAYITMLGWVIALFMNRDPKNEFSAFHIRQALGLHLLFLFLAVIATGFNNWSATIGFYVFIYILLIFGLSQAIVGKKTLIPFIGTYFQQWFKPLTQ